MPIIVPVKIHSAFIFKDLYWFGQFRCLELLIKKKKNV